MPDNAAYLDLSAPQILREKSPRETAEAFIHQLEAYFRGEWPFDVDISTSDPLEWWDNLKLHRHASVLAVGVFPIYF